MRPEYARMAEEQFRSPQDVQPDADIHLDVEGQVTLASLTRLVESWKDFLGEIGRGVTGNTAKDAVRYVITDASGGSFALCVRPQPARESVPASMMPQIARTVTSGIEELNQAAKRPSHFSDDALAKLRDLARLVGPETPTLTVSNGRRRPVALGCGSFWSAAKAVSGEAAKQRVLEGTPTPSRRGEKEWRGPGWSAEGGGAYAVNELWAVRLMENGKPAEVHRACAPVDRTNADRPLPIDPARGGPCG